METPVSEPILTPVQVPEPKAKFPVIYLILSLLILVFLASTAFLFYQNMQLKNTLASYQTQPTVSPTVTTYQSPVPTIDPTANWKTVKTKYFQISYPETLKVRTNNEFYLELISLSASAESQPTVVISATDVFRNPGGCSNPYTQTGKIILDGKDLTEGILEKNNGEIAISLTQNQIQCWFANNGITFMINYYGLKDGKEEFDQILSTFKFVK